MAVAASQVPDCHPPPQMSNPLAVHGDGGQIYRFISLAARGARMMRPGDSLYFDSHADVLPVCTPEERKHPTLMFFMFQHLLLRLEMFDGFVCCLSKQKRSFVGSKQMYSDKTGGGHK